MLRNLCQCQNQQLSQIINSGGNIFVKKKEQNSESRDEFYTKLGIITKEVAVGQVLDKFQEAFEHTLSHFIVKGCVCYIFASLFFKSN